MHNPHAAPSRKASQVDPLRAFMPIIIHVMAIGPTAEPEISVCKASIFRRLTCLVSVSRCVQRLATLSPHHKEERVRGRIAFLASSEVDDFH